MTNLVLSFIVWLNTYESLFTFIVLVLTIVSVVILPLCKLICAPKPNVNVSFEEGDSLTIYPEYIEEEDEEEDEEENVGMYGINNTFRHTPIVNALEKCDPRFCMVSLDIENTGDITLKDYSLRVQFEKEKVQEIKINAFKEPA